MDALERITAAGQPHFLRARKLSESTCDGKTVYAVQLVYEPHEAYQKWFHTRWHEDAAELIDEVIWTLEAIRPGALEDKDVNIFSTDLFEFLSGDMVGDGQIALTIKDVKIEQLTSSRGSENKPVVEFKERKKKLVLNKTNAKALAAELGPETDDWIGVKVVLTAPYVSAFGQRVRSVRVDAVLGKAEPSGKPKPRQASAPANGNSKPAQPALLEPEPAGTPGMEYLED